MSKIIGEKGNEAKRQSVKFSDGEARQLETPTTRLEDDAGTGKKVIIRRFDFKLAPLPKGIQRPKSKELLNYHVGRIISFLYKDGLDQAGDIKLLMNKNNRDFHIFVPCVASFGQNIIEKATTINAITQQKN